MNKWNKALIALLLLTLTEPVVAQSLPHPIIVATADERPQLLQTIATYDWARSMVAELHGRIDSIADVHKKRPQALLTTLPPFSFDHGGYSEQEAAFLANAHNRILMTASESGMLYYLTKNDKYAQLSADILTAYIEELAPKTPQTTTICGNEFYDPRTTYPHFALAYDFVYNFLKKENTKTFSSKLEKHIRFDNDLAQKALGNMIGNVLQEYGKPDKHGQRVSNHPILTAPGALFMILCVEDDTERERLFKIFWEEGTAHQNSFKNTILPLYSDQGLWPESLSYGFMPIVSMVLNIVDRIKPEMEVTKTAKHIFNGNFLYDYLRYPDRRFVRYGDSKRNNDFTENNYRYALHIAARHGYTDIAEKAQLALHRAYEAKGGYTPNLKSTSPYDQYQHLQLFWGIDVPPQLDSSIDFNKKTVIIEHAGIALQRNYARENNTLYGLCGIIGGAHYVHSHLTGIGMELYGAGYVMAPNAGLPPTVPERRIPLHEHYFRLYAGNNTVVVNGTSHGLDEGSWKGKANVWQNTVVNIAAEPKHLEEGIAEEFSFATQFLNDTVNNATQERTLSTIRTSETTGYYLDVFRSKSNGENLIHDYIYHNIGDTTHILDADGQQLALQPTQRYQNDIGDTVKSPGWRFFEETKTTGPTKEGIKVRFDIEYDSTYMHLFVPAGTEKEYTQALAPPTREAKNGYVHKKTQVLAIRQQGEAWDNPFIAIFETSKNQGASVQKVASLKDGAKTIGAIVSSKTDNSRITDIIISQDSDTALYKNDELGLSFKGRFGVVRTLVRGNTTEMVLYIGKGEQLIFEKKELNANADHTGVLRYNKQY
ncbi:hypothetical protein ACFQZJ_03835 [Maribacter chungangensis]|uniref:Heparinase II/III-like protein n=1 Tax=Maribacter chungangensis TaxID=1069117 RepID=A0ABW3AZU8_9FLAO